VTEGPIGVATRTFLLVPPFDDQGGFLRALSRLASDLAAVLEHDDLDGAAGVRFGRRDLGHGAKTPVSLLLDPAHRARTPDSPTGSKDLTTKGTDGPVVAGFLSPLSLVTHWRPRDR
jgi:hypothetical protein